MDSPWQGKHVLVTGGLGFLGSHFVTELLAHGAYVSAATRRADPRRCTWLPVSGNLRVLEFDPLDGVRLRAALCRAVPRLDAVVHCAGMDGNAEFKRRHSTEILNVNVSLAANVLNGARDAGIATVVLASSAETDAGPAQVPFVPGRSLDGYARSKAGTEFLAELHRTQYGTRTFLPRFANLYGPRDRFGDAARVIPAMLTRILSGDAVEVWGDGQQLRSFIHVTDAVRATLQIAAQDREHLVTIGTAEAISIVDLARLLFGLLDVPERISTVGPAGPERIGTAGAGDRRPQGRALDVSVMNRLIDFTPRTLRDGLAGTIRWYRAERGGSQPPPYAIRGT
ncbi:NAD-dependent epimerase/dehydratase family protein [Streptomyces sp. NBRC 110611]|uniref:NAD-dependent epimerase/dehydratase family protein n=1 Tax=Streptomyces sp. NBRC 110611 TaxID=1621259 RepID=UPI0008361815|nr:NAD(P)-dependent oxidoreductase [Streptomyces sp. NBRC 110611]GAU66498.1 NAD-dependent epimerase/dehydratase family protein [Streptomyces sp. NBRC 110611]